jgi:hypothetical protein
MWSTQVPHRDIGHGFFRNKKRKERDKDTDFRFFFLNRGVFLPIHSAHRNAKGRRVPTRVASAGLRLVLLDQTSLLTDFRSPKVVATGPSAQASTPFSVYVASLSADLLWSALRRIPKLNCRRRPAVFPEAGEERQKPNH